MVMITVTLLHPTMEDRKLTLELPRSPATAICIRTISAAWPTS